MAWFVWENAGTERKETERKERSSWRFKIEFNGSSKR
jgi:hypothetical protein